MDNELSRLAQTCQVRPTNYGHIQGIMPCKALRAKILLL